MYQSLDVAMQTAQFLWAVQNQMATAVHQTQQRALIYVTYFSFDLTDTNSKEVRSKAK